MVKILLVFDEYGESAQAETKLKKVGFDVVAISNELSLKEQILGFNPDLTIIHGKGHRIHGVSAAKRIKEIDSYKGKVLLIVEPNQKPTPQELSQIKIDTILVAPVDLLRVIEVITKLLKIDTEAVFEKFQKMQFHAEEQKNTSLKNQGGSIKVDSKYSRSEVLNKIDQLSRAELFSESQSSTRINLPSDDQNKLRTQKYDKYIQSIQFDVHQSTIKTSETRKRWKELKAEWDAEKLSTLDLLKKAFVNALFKKNNG